MRRHLLITCCLLLAGCKTCPVPKAPEVLEVVVTRTVAVPAELAEDCDVPAKQGNTVGDAVLLANQRKAALEECNKRLARIRGLAP